MNANTTETCRCNPCTCESCRCGNEAKSAAPRTDRQPARCACGPSCGCGERCDCAAA